MTVRLLVGDVHERLADIPDRSVDFIACSPPFLALRKYGDDDREMGSERTPADFLDALLELTQEFRRVLTPHGSIAIELGDTYAGDDRRNSETVDVKTRHRHEVGRAGSKRANVGNGWPPAKSLTLMPTLYPASLAYGWNMLNPAHTFEPWRVRNLIVWARPNPPVGALGDKVRPASSYITIACTSPKRWFDLDGVRTEHKNTNHRPPVGSRPDAPNNRDHGYESHPFSNDGNPAGAPPLDWWNLLTDRVDAALRQAAKGDLTQADLFGGEEKVGKKKQQKETAGGRLLREAWEAGEVDMPDFFPMSTQPYKGAHYATWPERLAARLIEMMCPRQVCTTCGQPSTRIVGEATYARTDTDRVPARLAMREGRRVADGAKQWKLPTGDRDSTSVTRQAPTLGWSDCGHNTWRPGMILDPFAGSGTTLAVAQGLGRDCTGIELYEANAELCRKRVGMFLEVDGDTQPAPIADVADIDLWEAKPPNPTAPKGSPRFRAGYRAVGADGTPHGGPYKKDYGA